MVQALRFVLAVAIGVVSTGCVTTPYDEQVVPGTAVSISGYTDAGNAAMVFKMYNFRTGGWDTVNAVAPVRSATQATFPAGYWGTSAPALYIWSGSIRGWADKYLAPRQDDYWDSNHARIQVFRSGNGQAFYGGDANSVACMATSPRTGDFYTTGYNCGFDDTVIDVYADVIH